MTDLAAKLDGWAEGGAAALVLEQPLRPVVGTLVFPPTFASERGSDDPSGYVIDTIDGRGIVTLDNPAAQANRIEPLFMSGKSLADLVPQIVIQIGNQPKKNLLELSHRAADALTCAAPEQRQRIRDAFDDVLEGNHESLADFAPTSLVFGAWDSRGTGAKLPRLLEARIDASGVELRRRNGQYFTSVDFVAEELLEYEQPKRNDDPRSKAGFRSTPTKLKPGGVELTDNGEIIRTLTIHLAGIQRIRAGSQPERSSHLRRYILGLALAAATCPMDLFLRQGCSLVPTKGEKSPQWRVVGFDGSEEPIALEHQSALDYALKARDDFFPGGPERFRGGLFRQEVWTASREGSEAELEERLKEPHERAKATKRQRLRLSAKRITSS